MKRAIVAFMMVLISGSILLLVLKTSAGDSDVAAQGDGGEVASVATMKPQSDAELNELSLRPDLKKTTVVPNSEAMLSIPDDVPEDSVRATGYLGQQGDEDQLRKRLEEREEKRRRMDALRARS